jgi:hypothetical protein
MRWLFETHMEVAQSLGIRPGFDTLNFPFLVKKFQEWGLDLSQVTIATPFNAVGFQMNPSKKECEEALSSATDVEVFGYSILAAGYLTLQQAAQYLIMLPNLAGVIVGISQETHARETFTVLRATLESRT